MNFEDQHRSKLDVMIKELSGLVRRALVRLCKRTTGNPFYLRCQDRGKGQCTPQRYTRRGMWREHEDLVDIRELLLQLLVVGGRRRLHGARVGVDLGTRSIEFDFARANRTRLVRFLSILLCPIASQIEPFRVFPAADVTVSRTVFSSE
jgi:hypothetical protein